MAKKVNKIIIPFSFEDEGNTLKTLKNNLSSVTKELNGSIGKNLAKSFADDFSKTVKEINKTLTKTNKPVYSKKEAQDLGNSIASALKKGNQHAVQLKESLQKAFDPKLAKEMSNTISSLESKLAKLSAAREKWSSLTSASRSSGDAGKIQRTINQDTRRKDELTASGSLTKAEKNELEEINTRLKENNKLLEEKRRIEAELNDLKAETGKATAAALDEEISKTKELIAENKNTVLTTEDYEKLLEVINQLIGSTEELSNESEDLGERSGQSYSEMKDAAIQAEEHTKRLSQTLREITGFGIGMNDLIRMFKSLTREAFNFYKSLDQALTDITIVSNLSRSQVQALTSDFIELSRQTGMAIDDIAQASVIFFQQGLSTNEVMEMTEVTAQFAKVAGSTVEKAADQLTAAINGYKVGVEGAIDVADKLNAVAAKSAASIDELATAMSKAASQANQTGLSMDKFYAIIGTIEEVTREAPENIGTSLKTIMARMQQIKEGNNTEDDTDVNAVETALRTVGIRLRDTNGQLKDLETVLDELGPKWAGLDRNTQAYLGTIIAGTRQQSRFISMMQNWDRVLELTEVSENSAGQQALMHKKAMEGLDAAINTLKNSWQEFLATLTNSDVFIKILKGAAQLLQNISKNSNLNTILTKAMALFVLINKTKIIEAFKQIGKSFKGIGQVLEQTKTSFSSIKESMKANKQAAEDYAKAQAEAAKCEQEIVDSLAREEQIRNRLEQLGNSDPAKRKELLDNLSKEGNLRKKNTTDLENYNKKMGESKKILDENAMSTEQYAGALVGAISAITMVTMVISTLLDVFGAAPEAGQIVSGTLQLIGGAVVALLAVVKAAENGMKFSAPVIYAILAGVAVAATGIASLIKGLQTMGDTSSKIKEVNDQLKELNKEYNVTNTEIQSLENYLDVYDTLMSKIILTKDEQEKLNEAIEAMAELGEIEYWTDEQGHNHIVRADVEGSINGKKEQNEKNREEARTKATENLHNYYTGSAVPPTISSETEAFYDDEAKAQGMYRVSLYSDRGNLIGYYYFTSEEDAKDFKGKLDKYTKTKTQEDYKKMREAFEKRANPKENQSIPTAIVGSTKYEAVGGGAHSKGSFDRAGYSVHKAYDEYVSSLNDYYTGSDTYGKELNKAIQKRVLDENQMKEIYSKSGKTRDDVEKYVKERDETMKKLFDSDWGKKLLEGGIKNYKEQLEQDTNTTLNEINDNIDKFYNEMEGKLEEDDADYNDKMEAIRIQREAAKATFYESFGFDIDKVNKYGLGSFSSSSLGAMNKIGMFSENNADMIPYLTSGTTSIFDENGKEQIVSYAEAINEAFKVSDEDGAMQLYKTIVDIENEMGACTLESGKMKETLEAQLGSVQVPSWSNWSEQFKEITQDARNFANIMKTLREEGGMSVEQFGDLMGMLDDLGNTFANTGDLANLQKLTSAIDQMDFAIDASTSSIKINGKAMTSLGDIEQTLTEAKIESARAGLEGQQKELEAQRAALVAYAGILKARLKGAGEKQDTENELLTAYQEMLNRENKLMADDLDRKEAYYKSLANMKEAEVEGKGADAIAAVKNKAGTQAKVHLSSWTKSGKQITSAAGQELNTVLEEIAILDNQIANVKKMQELWKKMKKVDWSKWGSGSKSGANSAAKDYMAQLNKIAELLTHIEQEEAKINTLEKLRAMQTGRANIKNLLEEIKLTEHLQGDYVDKYNLEKKAALAAKKTIQQAYGKVIKFNEDGSYTLNEKKYNKMSDKQKEQLDELINSYKESIKAATESYDKAIEYIQKEMEYRQYAVDKYIEAENDLVEAIKTREKKILDAKLAAIDKEIEAIEKVAEARRKAREEESDAAEMSGLQVDLQRALMDSSGASASQILALQKQIKDKQKEMADSSFDDMVNDMKQQLEDEKQLEQDLFDERLEEMDWYWAEVDRIMGEGVESVLDTMKLYSDEYNQASEVQQAEVLKGWTDTFEQAVVIGEVGAKEMQAAIQQIQDAMNKLAPEDVEGWLNLAKTLTTSSLGIQDNSTEGVDVDRYASGGMNYRTGLAWLDGSRSNPEAVLNAAQTKAFLSFTDDLAALRASGGITNNANVIIDTISFNVDSMSSPEDGERAFDAFVNKFKQIGAKQGISVNGTANRF